MQQTLWEYLKLFVIEKILYIDVGLTGPDDMERTNTILCSEGFVVMEVYLYLALAFLTVRFACTLRCKGVSR